MKTIRSFWRTLLETLREVFDENAYHRFLLQTNDVASPESYGRFLREREVAMARKPRCC